MKSLLILTMLVLLETSARSQGGDFDSVNAPANELDFGDDSGDYPDAGSSMFDDNPVNYPNNNPVNSNAKNTENISIQAVDVAPNIVEQPEPTIKAAPVIETNDFSGAPMVPGTLRNLADGEAPEEYVVESGDTLFDVCSQLLDEGGYWPKLWALNPQIKNPHFIWPGMKLVFYSGNKDFPPFMEVVEDNDIVPIDKGGIKEENLMTGTVPNFEDTTKKIPTELVDADSLRMSDIIEVRGSRFNPTKKFFVIPGFIYAEEKKSLGTVISGIEGENIIGDTMKFGIKTEENLAAGKTYTLLRAHGEIENPNSGDDVGYYYSTVGHFKVDEVYSDKQLVIGVSTQDVIGIEPGDMVVDYISTNRVISLTEKASGVKPLDGTVIAFKNETQTLSAGDGLVFIDRGQNNGVSNGQFYEIYRYAADSATDDVKEQYNGHKILAGTIKIVDTTDVASVGYLVEMSKEINRGDALTKDTIN